ncbi:MAG: four helix bundle protein [Anaerolineae bacterium]
MRVTEPRTYEEWSEEVPLAIKDDSLWRMTAYRLSLFAGDLGWHDTQRLIDARLWGLADQLYRALGSISAKVAEGYSRSTVRDRARFSEYALGSARESREWYFKARHVLGDEVFQHRLTILTRIIQLLTKTIPDQRKQSIREPSPPYTRTEEPPTHRAPIPYADDYDS